MYCYRRRGHNEGDEPAFTQPVLYRAIEQRRSVRESYLEHLLLLGEITREEADRIADERRATLEQELSVARSRRVRRRAPESLPASGRVTSAAAKPDVDEVDTGVDARAAVATCSTAQTQLPADFHPHPKIERLLEARREMAARRARRWIGRRPRRWPSPAWPTTASACADAARTARAARSASGTPCCTTTKTATRYTPLQHLGAGPGAGRDLQQPALRDGRAGLRIRLQPRLPRRRW